MQVGDVARRTRTVRERDIELFTELTGDRNPVHYDAELAERSKFGGIVVQGGSPVAFSTLSRPRTCPDRAACSCRWTGAFVPPRALETPSPPRFR